jgi:hypothetical protein
MYLYYWYSYWLNNMVNSNITLLLLLYYITLSAYNEILYEDYSIVLQKWWSKPLRVNLRSRKKRHPQRRSRFRSISPSAGHRPENRHARVRRRCSGAGRGKSRYTREDQHYYYYLHYIYKLIRGKDKQVRSTNRILPCCFSGTRNQKGYEHFGTDDNSTKTYDSDSKWIGVDSLSTYCITNSMSDFIEKPKPIRRKIKGINDAPAQLTCVGKGIFKILDSKGRQHKFYIDKLYYCSTVPMKIISPQHLDTMWKERDPSHRLRSYVDSGGCVLQWLYKNKEFSKLIPINKKTGVPMFKSSPGYQQVASYVARNNEITNDDQVMCCQAARIIDDDKKTSYISEYNPYRWNYPPMAFEGELTPKRSNVSVKTPKDRKEPVTIEFGDDNIKETPIADSSDMDPTSEMLYLHYKLGHLSFNKIRKMAHDGLVPKKFLRCRVPTCASCMYRKATKRPWRTKTPTNQIQPNKTSTSPGHCVSIDQFESPVPGMIAHVKGKPTTARYKCGTVFVDHYSDVTYVHFQKSTSATETIEAKEAFERWSESNGVKIKHYHADNGRFAENAFMNHIDKSNQTISFCGVNAHFQNGRAERRI